MKIILSQAQGELVEKKSRFIATMMPVQDQAQAEQFIAACKKKYWDAKHNCSAYVIGENNEIMHSSDDGEPSGTAGRPMLSVLTGADIHNTAVVVTRYFGGVLLGTGGLVRAYQGAVQAALAQAQIAEQIVLTELTVCVEYALVQTMQYYMGCHPDYRTLDTVYAADVSFQIGVPAGETDRVLQELSELSKGKARITKGETRLSI